MGARRWLAAVAGHAAMGPIPMAPPLPAAPALPEIRLKDRAEQAVSPSGAVRLAAQEKTNDDAKQHHTAQRCRWAL
jgi:hypothetical protein